MAFDDVEHPRLIPLEPHEVTLEDGSPAIALRDPTGVVDGMVVVPPPVYAVMSFFDGTRTAGEVEQTLLKHGFRIAVDQIAQLAKQLGEAGLLHGSVYQARRQQALAEYRAAPIRAPSCAGGAYPHDPGELRRLLDGFFSHQDGPGGPPQKSEASGLRLLVSPHIDYQRGGASYAHAWRALAESCDAELFVILGTAHASPAHLFTLTRQSFDTPLGAVQTDGALLDALVSELGEEELLGDELCHRQEHSIELQMVWLRHVFPDRPITTLPVLCSSISHLGDPQQATSPFLVALQRAVAGRKVCFVAGADLAHVGPQFGDSAPPTASELESLAREDLRTLDFVSVGNPLAFYRDAVRDEHRRRICGVAPIYAAMRLAGIGAQLLHYGQWSNGTDSVSFAAAAG